MQLFVRVVERGSFLAAAADLGLARSTATQAIKALEADVGARLLERTTRHVAVTLDGSAFYQRCLSILADVDEAEAIFRDAKPQGILRVDAHPVLTQTFLLPHLRSFLDRYPLLEIQFGQGDRFVDLVREGVDCVIRAGEVTDSSLIMRRLGSIREMTCASPDYIKARGMPRSLDDLEGHQVVGAERGTGGHGIRANARLRLPGARRIPATAGREETSASPLRTLRRPTRSEARSAA